MSKWKASTIYQADLLVTGFIDLCIGDSEPVLKIHEGILRTKGGTISAAFADSFKEATERRYCFEETDQFTIKRFVEWAYRGDYEIESPNATERAMEHLNIYIFATLYGITELATLSAKNFAECLRVTGSRYEIGWCPDWGLSPCARPALELAFERLSYTDQLYRWLGVYVLANISEIRENSEFDSIWPQMALAAFEHVPDGPQRNAWNGEVPNFTLSREFSK